jgi:hypothetical protein
MADLEGPAPMDDRAIVEDVLDAFGTGRQVARLTARSPDFTFADAYRIARDP